MENFSPVVHSPVTDELTTAPGAPEAGAGMPGEEWEQHRPAVFGVAYRLLGSVADAEDVTQDVWLRTARVRPDGIADPRAWLVTVAARRAYDVLRSARVRREEYVVRAPGRDRHEPGPRVGDAVRPDAGGAQPHVLRHVLGVRDAAQQPVGHPEDGRPVLFPLLAGHPGAGLRRAGGGRQFVGHG
ncbi:hypothetical protein TPA0909_61060 [Streptomyces albus]|nr:hypothetical protein TPA0909_61060 [Streptomyces albus]